MSNAVDIILTPSPDLARPLTILPAIEVEHIQALIAAAGELAIESATDYSRASALLNSLTKARGVVDKTTSEKAEPFRAEAERIRAEGKPFIELCQQVEAKLSALMVAYKQTQLLDALTAPAGSSLPSSVLTAPPAGTRERTVVKALECDIKLLPLTYHIVDEAKVKKHILDGTITTETPGVRFTLETVIGGSGR